MRRVLEYSFCGSRFHCKSVLLLPNRLGEQVLPYPNRIRYGPLPSHSPELAIVRWDLPEFFRLRFPNCVVVRSTKLNSCVNLSRLVRENPNRFRASTINADDTVHLYLREEMIRGQLHDI